MAYRNSEGCNDSTVGAYEIKRITIPDGMIDKHPLNPLRLSDGYDSPIMVKTFADRITAELDGRVFGSIEVDFGVNREELIKALEYDRNQYEVGYEDGWRNAMMFLAANIDKAEEILSKLKEEEALKGNGVQTCMETWPEIESERERGHDTTT